MTYSSLGGWVIAVFIFSQAIVLSAHSNTSPEAVQKLIDQAEAFSKLSNHNDQVDSCYSLALNLAIEGQHLQLEKSARYGKALVLYNRGNYSSSTSILDSLLLDADQLGQPLHANILKLLANDLVYQGKYARAYENQLKAYEYFSEQRDTLNMASLHFSIGNNLFYQEQFDLALEEFNNSLTLYENKKHKKGIYWSLGAIASVYEHQVNLEQALEFAERSLQLAMQLDSKEDIAWTLYIIGSIASTAGELNKAKKNLLKAKNLAIELEDEPFLGYVLEALTAMQIRNKEYYTALKTLDESFEIAEQNNDQASLPGLYKFYSDIHFELKNYTQAREYTSKYIALRDSLHNAELASSMGSLKKDFQVREVERVKEIELLKKDAKLKSFRIFFWLGAFVIAALSFIFYLVIGRVKSKHVREKNELLLANNQRILEQNEALKSSNRDLKQYAYILSHDLKEPLRNIGSFTNLLRRRLSPTLDQESKDYMGYISHGVEQMHTLLIDLLEYSKIRNKSKVPVSIDANEVVKEVMVSMQPELKKSNAKIHIADLPKINIDQDHFYQIIMHLLDNSLKFSRDNDTEIHIGCETRMHDFVFSVEDNGIGIDPAFHEKVFVVFQRLNNRAEYSGSGIGLATCKKIISEYGGKIWLESGKGDGTTFYFSLPKHQSIRSNSQLSMASIKSPQLN